MVQITIDNAYCKISGLNDKKTLRHLDESLSYFVQGYAFTKAYKTGWWDNKTSSWKKWDGKNHLLSNNLRFRTGLLYRVGRILKNNGIKYTIIDNREDIKFGKKIKLKNVESREYQDRIHEACINNMSGVVKSCTGSGKSISIARLIADTNIKTNLFVTSIDLLYQMKEMFDEVGIKAGIIGDGKAQIKKINIVSIWSACSALDKKYDAMDDEDNLAKRDKIIAKNKTKIAKCIREAKMNIWDECHMVACQTIKDISSESVSARYTIGFSGTPFRSDGADLLIEAICGREIVEVTASELINKGFLVQPTIHIIDVPKLSSLSSDKYQTVYKEYIVENDVRNSKIVKATNKLVESGRQVLILVKNIKHGKILLENFDPNRVVFIRGELDSYERNQIREDFVSGLIDVVIATQIFDQGVNLPPLSALVLAGSGCSPGRALQRLGRILRPYHGKKDAIVVDFIDNATHLLRHTSKRLETYRTEAGFKIKLPKKKGYNDGSKKTKKAKGKRLPSGNSGGEMSW